MIFFVIQKCKNWGGKTLISDVWCVMYDVECLMWLLYCTVNLNVSQSKKVGRWEGPSIGGAVGGSAVRLVGRGLPCDDLTQTVFQATGSQHHSPPAGRTSTQRCQTPPPFTPSTHSPLTLQFRPLLTPPPPIYQDEDKCFSIDHDQRSGMSI